MAQLKFGHGLHEASDQDWLTAILRRGPMCRTGLFKSWSSTSFAFIPILLRGFFPDSVCRRTEFVPHLHSDRARNAIVGAKRKEFRSTRGRDAFREAETE